MAIWLTFWAAFNGLLSQMLFGYSAGMVTGALFKEYSLIMGIFVFAMAIGAILFERVKNPLGPLLLIQFASPLLVGLCLQISIGQMAHSFEIPSLISFYSAALAVGILAGGELPLIYLLCAKNNDLNNVLVSDYLAMSIGSLLFGTVFMPMLGVNYSWIILAGGHALFTLSTLYFSAAKKNFGRSLEKL